MISGQLRKMGAQIDSTSGTSVTMGHGAEAQADTKPVAYQLIVGPMHVPLNPHIGKEITLSFLNRITCVHCSREMSKSYNQGYCYVCARNLAQCDLCIMKPHTCHHHLGTCREPAWGEAHCMQPHYVYLANSSHLKVGITRKGQIPTRWLDQGAVQALPLFYTRTRYHAGLIEHCLTRYVADKTNWRALFKDNIPLLDLPQAARELFQTAEKDLQQLLKHYPEMQASEIQPLLDDSHAFVYPVAVYPTKVQSLSFDKQARIQGTLLGIKGQYLIFDSGVLNIRKHGGYHVAMEY